MKKRLLALLMAAAMMMATAACGSETTTAENNTTSTTEQTTEEGGSEVAASTEESTSTESNDTFTVAISYMPDSLSPQTGGSDDYTSMTRPLFDHLFLCSRLPLYRLRRLRHSRCLFRRRSRFLRHRFRRRLLLRDGLRPLIGILLSAATALSASLLWRRGSVQIFLHGLCHSPVPLIAQSLQDNRVAPCFHI